MYSYNTVIHKFIFY